ncbi:MAG: ABC transporter permease [Anaerolineae bacterium]|nr:ABC transporter permease [Anaerolineae bacterium]
MSIRLKRIGAIMRKEIIQTVRDWPTLLLVLLLPVILLTLFAFLGNMMLEHMPTAVADLSQDRRSVSLIDALEVSGFFDIALYLESEEAVIQAIDGGEAMVGVVIPPDFAAQVERGTAQALIIIDGSDSFIVQSAYNTAGAVAQMHAMEIVLETAERMGMGSMGRLPINTATHILYNPNIDGMIFLIPGAAAILLQMLTVGLTAQTVVRERELGTMEQILVTPARPIEIIIGKLIPGITITLCDLAIILLMGVFVFKVPFQGSVLLFGLLSLVFIVSGLALGLLLSTVGNSQRQVQQFVMILVMLGMLLTGLIYPRSTMPPLVRAVGDLIPATYFTRIARGIITKGVGFHFVWQDVVVLVVYGVLAVVIAAKTFRRRLD